MRFLVSEVSLYGVAEGMGGVGMRRGREEWGCGVCLVFRVEGLGFRGHHVGNDDEQAQPPDEPLARGHVRVIRQLPNTDREKRPSIATGTTLESSANRL